MTSPYRSIGILVSIIVSLTFQTNVMADHLRTAATFHYIGQLPPSPAEKLFAATEDEIYEAIKKSYCANGSQFGSGLFQRVNSLAKRHGIETQGKPIYGLLRAIEAKLDVPDEAAKIGLINHVFNLCMHKKSPYPEVDAAFLKRYGDPKMMSFEDRLAKIEEYYDRGTLIVRSEERAAKKLIPRIQHLGKFIHQITGTEPTDDKVLRAKIKELSGVALPEIDPTVEIPKEIAESVLKILQNSEAQMEVEYARRLKERRNPHLGITPKVLKQRVEFLEEIRSGKNPTGIWKP